MCEARERNQNKIRAFRNLASLFVTNYGTIPLPQNRLERRTTTMRILATNLLLIVSFVYSVRSQTISEVSAVDTSCSEASARILILGIYHMDNPRLDSKNIEADDVLLPRRQGEILELVEKLAKFKPDKIAIEAPYQDLAWISRYQKFLTGNYQLGRNEIEQIGFQLAKRLGLTTLYPIDFPIFMSGLTPSEVEYPKPKPNQNSTPAAVTKPAQPSPLSDEDKLLRGTTVTEFLRYLNNERRIQDSQKSYMQMLMLTDDPAIYSRADRVTNWYKRNLRMFANINRITEFPTDRILLIVGFGHLKILRDFAIDAPQYCLIETQTYLK